MFKFNIDKKAIDTLIDILKKISKNYACIVKFLYL